MTPNRRGREPFAGAVPLLGVLVSLVVAVGPGRPLSAQQAPDLLSSALLDRLTSEAGVGVEPVRFEAELRRFYSTRDFEPLWLSPDGRPTRLGPLLAELRRAEEDGLRASDYRVSELSARVEVVDRFGPLAKAELELAIGDAFLRFASDLARGRVDPLELEGEWSGERDPFEALGALHRAAGPSSVGTTLAALRPQHGQYDALRSALAGLRATPAWGTVPPGETLEPGDVDERVVALRERLRQSGDAPAREGSSDGPVASNPLRYDADLEAAVRAFQGRHGLAVDGKVGPQTVRALNVSVAERILQVEINLERWRWLPHDLGTRRVIVNVPGFSVTLEGPDGPVATHRAIVGQLDRETPTFSSVIEWFALAPYWWVPTTPAVEDVLPKIRADAAYLEREGIEVLEQATGEVVDPRTIDWHAIPDADVLARYHLRQQPGPRNALGTMKIAFPNPYAVFMHDTPAQSLFDAPQRAFSSGCIRVERPLEMLDWLLAGDPEWPQERITDVIEAGEELSSRVPEPVPIHVLYLTALAEADGRLAFLPDVYGQDGALGRALKATPIELTAHSAPAIGSCS